MSLHRYDFIRAPGILGRLDIRHPVSAFHARTLRLSDPKLSHSVRVNRLSMGFPFVVAKLSA